MKITPKGICFTSKNRQQLKELVQTGRWNNVSEVVRAALHQFYETERARDLSPYSEAEMRAAARRQTPKEKAEDRRLAKASARCRPTGDDE